MKLNEVFDSLSNGELSNISFSRRTDGAKGITEADYPAVLSSINLGLTDLHVRFPLKVGTLIVDLTKGRNSYILTSQHQATVAGMTDADRYIRFDNERLKNEVLKIEGVYDSQGNEWGLNDGDAERSVFTPNERTIIVPDGLYNALEGKWLKIEYRKSVSPIVIGEGYFDPATTEVDLPRSHLQALLYFVASRAHNPIGFNESVHEGNNYASKYENACAMLTALNLRVDVVQANDRIRRGGWV